jgi:translation elongation factor EF-1beta
LVRNLCSLNSSDASEIETLLREIDMEGLEWKNSWFEEDPFEATTLQITCHIVNDRVKADDILEKIRDYDFTGRADIVSISSL